MHLPIGQSLRYLFFVSIFLFVTAPLILSSCVTVVQPTGVTPSLSTTSVSTIDDACNKVESYLLNLASTAEANRFLAIYREIRWGIHSFVLVEDYNQHQMRVEDDKYYAGWNVKQYIVQHVFDDVIFDRNTYPDAKVLSQILSISGCWGYDNPNNEVLYTVRWIVDKQTGTVTPENDNALKIKAKLME